MIAQSRPNLTDPGRVIAHRGASQMAPENTLAAFRMAAEQGASWVEFDVSLLGDGTPVLHHDATLDRCTDGQGALTALSVADLAGLDAGGWKGAAFRGEPVALLEQALDTIEALGFYANLEMKAHDESPGPLARAVADCLARRSWARDRIIVSSFDHDELRALRPLAPDLALAVLYENPPPDWRRMVYEVDAAALHMDWHHLRRSLLVEARAHGLDVRVYTANQPALVKPFCEMGLTGIVTDHPPLYLDDPAWADWVES